MEVTAAIVLMLLAAVLRWTRPRAGSGSASHEGAISPTRWASVIPRPTSRQALDAVLVGCAVGLFIDGRDGVLVGVASSVGVLVFNSRRASNSEKHARLRLIAAAPPVVDLFAAGLAAGLLPAAAAAIAATAFTTPDEDDPPAHVERLNGQHNATWSSGLQHLLLRMKLRILRAKRRNATTTPHAIGPTREIAERFATAAESLRRGVNPETAWRALAVDDATAPVAAAALRASRTGAPASETVAKAARDLWNVAERSAQKQVHSVAVRAAVPLALCFLPSFVLVGIAPTAIGILAELRP